MILPEKPEEWSMMLKLTNYDVACIQHIVRVKKAGLRVRLILLYIFCDNKKRS